MNWSAVFQYSGPLLHGLLVTAEVSLASLAGSIIPGILIALLNLSERRLLRLIGQTLVALFRNIPSLVQLFLVYYLVPPIIHVEFSPFVSAVIAFVLNGAGYVSEIIRAGVLSVPKGQWEAAQTLGIGGWRLYYRVILPQAMIVMLGPFMNEISRQIKSSSLASIVAVTDLMYVVSGASSATFLPVTFYTAGAGLYYLLILPFGTLSRFIEARTYQAGQQARHGGVGNFRVFADGIRDVASWGSGKMRRSRAIP